MEHIKFVIRLNQRYFKLEQKLMASNDEWIEVQYQYNRVRKHVKDDKELYNYYESGKTIKIRFVNIELPTWEVETIMTNLESDKFSTEDINDNINWDGVLKLVMPI